MTIGGVNLLELGLKAFVFTEADAYDRSLYPPPAPFPVDVYNRSLQTSDAETKAMLERWAADYRQWESTQKNIDQVAAMRQRDAASDLAMILVGLPLYLYHWRAIRRESGDRKQSQALRES